MRFLHTGDWHLGRMIRQQSRMDECARVLDEVVGIAKERGVDAVIIAGDTFDTFSPSADADRLLYETLSRLLADGSKVVMIAGNHDHAPRMDALSGILQMVGVHSIGSVPNERAASRITVASRDGNEAATIVALPWVPERYALEFEMLGKIEDAKNRYRAVLEHIVKSSCTGFPADTINLFVGHMLIDGVSIGEGSSERKLHIGQAFAVNAACIPDTVQYVALGHVHRPQAIGASAPTHYAGSLLQLDFGEAGQAKSVNIVDIKPGLPASKPELVPITGGRGLRNVTLRLDDLSSHADAYGEDYLRVFVELEAPASSLYDRVREVLPNALDVTALRKNEPASVVAIERQGLAPHELFARYYNEKHKASPSEPLMAAFNELYEEASRASA